jgi:hypothetical protein
MRGVPVAVIIETAGSLQDAGYLNTPRAHEIYVGLGRCMPIFECALFFRLTPEYFIIAIGVKRGVDVNKINAAVGKFAQLIKAVTTIDDGRIDQCRSPRHIPPPLLIPNLPEFLPYQTFPKA